MFEVVLCPYEPDHVAAEAFFLGADVQPLYGQGERDIPVPSEDLRAAYDDVLPITGRNSPSPILRGVYARLLPVLFPQQREGDRR